MNEGHGGIVGNNAKHYQGFQQADLSAQKEAFYRQSLNANTAGMDAPAQLRGSEEIVRTIAQRLQFTEEVAHRLSAMADRVCGAVPTCAGEGGKVNPLPDSLASRLHMLLLAVEQINARMTDSVQRLESFV